MKAAALYVIDECEAGRITSDDAADQLAALAANLPDLDPDQYRQYQIQRLRCADFDRARRLVNCLGDQTFQPWVIPTLKGLWLLFKLSVLAAFVWLIVWLAK